MIQTELEQCRETISKVRAERDNLERIASEGSRICAKLQDRAEKAEAEVERLNKELRAYIETVRGAR